MHWAGVQGEGAWLAGGGEDTVSSSNMVLGTVMRGGRRQWAGEEGEEGEAEGRAAGTEAERRKKGEKGAECEAEQGE